MVLLIVSLPFHLFHTQTTNDRWTTGHGFQRFLDLSRSQAGSFIGPHRIADSFFGVKSMASYFEVEADPTLTQAATGLEQVAAA